MPYHGCNGPIREPRVPDTNGLVDRSTRQQMIVVFVPIRCEHFIIMGSDGERGSWCPEIPKFDRAIA
eukprot:scaffold718_cov342-Pavlova_lutheri.AAC.39